MRPKPRRPAPTTTSRSSWPTLSRKRPDQKRSPGSGEHMLTAAQEQAERAISAPHRSRQDQEHGPRGVRARHRGGAQEGRQRPVECQGTGQADGGRGDRARHGYPRRASAASTCSAPARGDDPAVTEILTGFRPGRGRDGASFARGRSGSERGQRHRAEGRESAAGDPARTQGGSAPSRNPGAGTQGGDRRRRGGNQRASGNGTAGQNAAQAGSRRPHGNLRPVPAGRASMAGTSPARQGVSRPGRPSQGRSRCIPDAGAHERTRGHGRPTGSTPQVARQGWTPAGTGRAGHRKRPRTGPGRRHHHGSIDR